MVSFDTEVTGLKKIEDLPFYHSSLSRNSAEVLLISNGFQGSYLIRPSNHGLYSVSVRFKESVKHFPLTWAEEEKCYKFGLWQFSTVEEMVDHFNNLPILGGESGPPVTLKHPYINDVEELRIYSAVKKHGILGREYKPAELDTTQPFDLTIASKEGFLTKKGAIIKNWKKRWFVVSRNLMKYYKKCGDKTPKRVLNLQDAIEVKRDDASGKANCFRLVFEDRVFQMCAESEQDLDDWLRFLQWKIDHFKNLNVQE